MKVVALKTFSDGVISMYKGEVMDMDDAVAEGYLADGYVEKYGPLEINIIEEGDVKRISRLDKKFREIEEAFPDRGAIVHFKFGDGFAGDAYGVVMEVCTIGPSGDIPENTVFVFDRMNIIKFLADSPEDYPVLDE